MGAAVPLGAEVLDDECELLLVPLRLELSRAAEEPTFLVVLVRRRAARFPAVKAARRYSEADGDVERLREPPRAFFAASIASCGRRSLRPHTASVMRCASNPES